MSLCSSLAAFLIGLLFVAPVAECLASAPQSIHYQGYLTDDLGEPVNDTVEMEFRLYDVEVAGEAFWSTDGPLAVDIESGVFRVTLAPITAAELAAGDVWLGITVVPSDPGEPSQEMSPRLKVRSVPFALVAEHATSADFAGEAASVTAIDFTTFATGEDVEGVLGVCIQEEDLTAALAGYCEAPCYGDSDVEGLLVGGAYVTEVYLTDNAYLTGNDLDSALEGVCQAPCYGDSDVEWLLNEGAYVTELFLTENGYVTLDALAQWVEENVSLGLDEEALAAYLAAGGYLTEAELLWFLAEAGFIKAEDLAGLGYVPGAHYTDADVELVLATKSYCQGPCFSGNYADLSDKPDLDGHDADTVDGFDTNATGTPVAQTIPITDETGKIPQELLPFNKGDLLAPADRQLVEGLEEYENDYFNIDTLGIFSNTAANVLAGVQFGPGGSIQGTAEVPVPLYQAIGADAAGGPTSGGFWPKQLNASGDPYYGKAFSASVKVQVPVLSSPLYYSDGFNSTSISGTTLTRHCEENEKAPDCYLYPSWAASVGDRTLTAASATGSGSGYSGSLTLLSVLYGPLKPGLVENGIQEEVRYWIDGIGVPQIADWQAMTPFVGDLSPLHDGSPSTSIHLQRDGNYLNDQHIYAVYRISGLDSLQGDAIRVEAIFDASENQNIPCGWPECSFSIWNFEDDEWSKLKDGHSCVDNTVIVDFGESGPMVQDGEAYFLFSSGWLDDSDPLNAYLKEMTVYGANKNPIPLPVGNDFCEYATILELSGGITSVQGTTMDPAGNYTALDDYSEAECGGLHGPDAVYLLTLDERSTVEVTVVGSFDAVSYLREGDCESGVMVACGGGTLSTDPLEPGQYHVFVDSSDALEAGDFTLIVQSTPAPLPGNDDCGSAETLSLVGGQATVSGTTMYAEDQNQGTCGGDGGGEVVYSFVTTQLADLSVELAAGFDSVLYLRTGSCTDGFVVSCSTNGALNLGGLSPGAYFLFVDGGSAEEAGDFDVSVILE